MVHWACLILHSICYPQYTLSFRTYVLHSGLLQESDGGGTCPFCRCEIKGTERIVIDSFDPIEANKKLGYETIIEKSTVKNVVSFSLMWIYNG